MGRKSAKGKEKAKARKEELVKLKASQIVVDAANQQEDPMSQLMPFKKFDRNGLCVNIEAKKRAQVSEDDIEWGFQLTKQNMQTQYEQSEWGWKDKEKKDEMLEDAAWYLIARTEEGRPVGISHFRFDLDFDDQVLYCYEIQLTKDVRRKGLGKFMMQILELMAHKAKMEKVMLTAFKHNKDATEFFIKTLKYEVDETSPEDNIYDEEEYTYHILSKTIVQRPPLAKVQEGQTQNKRAVAT